MRPFIACELEAHEDQRAQEERLRRVGKQCSTEPDADHQSQQPLDCPQWVEGEQGNVRHQQTVRAWRHRQTDGITALAIDNHSYLKGARLIAKG